MPIQKILIPTNHPESQYLSSQITMLEQHKKDKKTIIISLGDPAGIGMEVTLKALGSSKLSPNLHPILVGCRASLLRLYSQLKSNGITPLVNPKKLEIEDLPIKEELIPGKPSAATGEVSFQWLTRATELVINKKAMALVTAPIAKHAWHAAGHNYPGQTERLAELTKSQTATMLFTAISPYSGWRFNTMLATTHIPLSQVSQQLSPELIHSKLEILLNFCQQFTVHPKIIVAGLNPHAGEEGCLGQEEIKWLIPLLKQWKINHPGISLEGPLAPDTCWVQAAKAWKDKPMSNTPHGFLALYHDQGLIPIKLLAFDEAVNTTVGLPFLRTSPDHGTAFDIAKSQCARPDSMIAALKTAWDLAQ